MSQIKPLNKIYLVPYWIIEQLERAKKPLATLADLPALAEVCSSEDISCLMLINDDPTPVFGRPPRDSSLKESALPTDLTQAWLEHSQSPLYSRALELAPIAEPTLTQRLFTKESYDEAYPEEFAIRDLADGCLYVIIYPGYFAGSDAKYYGDKLTRAILKQLYGTSNFDSIARSTLFHRYLMSL